jgi:PIN domain nuclease of toxin-antitoxin system
VKLLLDTHTLLWFALNDPQLSAVASTAIINPANENWVSPVSYWEVAIKISIGKYKQMTPFENFWINAIDMNSFQILHILPKHATIVSTLAFPSNNHRDPFDRLIVAQPWLNA